MYKTLLIAGACIGLAACASVPTPLEGQFAEVSPENANQADGSRVRWGGEVIKTVPAADHTCIYALSRPLDRSTRPRDDQDSMGRFVACRQGFYDPEVFAKGRDITVTGTLDGHLTSKVGDYDYSYPRIAADTIYLWPRIKPRLPYNSGYYNSPFYDPFWGPGYLNPYWVAPTRVIVVPRQEPKPGGN